MRNKAKTFRNLNAIHPIMLKGCAHGKSEKSKRCKEKVSLRKELNLLH